MVHITARTKLLGETRKADTSGSDRLTVVFHRLNISWTLMYPLNAGEEYLIEKGGARGAKVVAGIRTLPSTSETLPKT